MESQYHCFPLLRHDVCVLRLVVCLVALVGASWAQLGDAAQQSCDADVDAHVFGRLSHNATGHWSATATLQRTLHAQDSALQMEAIPRVWRVNGTTKQSISITITGSLFPPEPEYKNRTASRRSVNLVDAGRENRKGAEPTSEKGNAQPPKEKAQRKVDEIIPPTEEKMNITTVIPTEKKGVWNSTPEPEQINTTASRRSVYMVHVEPETWERAKSICEEENAHLLILNSQQEADDIIQLLKEVPNIGSGIPIGITDKEKEGEWKTIFGESLLDVGYSNWGKVEPDGGLIENCGYVTSITMVYYDGRCGAKKSFICEKMSEYE